MQRKQLEYLASAPEEFKNHLINGKPSLDDIWKKITPPKPDEKLSPKDINGIKQFYESLFGILKIAYEGIKVSDAQQKAILDGRFQKLDQRISPHIQYTSSHTQLNCDLSTPPQVGQENRAVVTLGAGTLAADTAEIVGSTFVRVSRAQPGDERKEAKKEKSFVLDGGHREYLTDKAGNVTGFVIARSDGCGHLGGTDDKHGWEKDQLTGEITRLLVTEGARLIKEAAQTYKDPAKAAKHVETEKNNMVMQLQTLATAYREKRANELKIPAGEVDNRATLTIGIALKLPTGGFQFAGFSIGKTMFVALDTSTNTVTQVVPAVKKIQGLTESIPYFRKELDPADIAFFNTSFSAVHAILDPSDGVFDSWPCDSKTQPNSDRTVVSLSTDAFVGTELNR